jgi:histidine triad (HIT) family protein
MSKTIFKRIIDREIPAKIVYEDDLCLAFEDVNPQAPVHILVIPKKEIPSLDDLTESDAALAGHLLVVVQKLATERKLTGGYRVVANCGPDAGQSVAHLHFHLLGGRSLSWPPG